MWLLKACFLLIFPDPVIAKRFFAPDTVFCLGIFFSNLFVKLTVLLPATMGHAYALLFTAFSLSLLKGDRSEIVLSFVTCFLNLRTGPPLEAWAVVSLVLFLFWGRAS